MVVLVEKLLLSAVRFTASKLPLIKSEPVNKWVSVISSPNSVEPLRVAIWRLVTDELTIKFWAVILPVVVISPLEFIAAVVKALLNVLAPLNVCVPLKCAVSVSKFAEGRTPVTSVVKSICLGVISWLLIVI